MHRKHQRQLTLDDFQGGHNPLKYLALIHVTGTMQGHDTIRARLQTEPFPQLEADRACAVLQQGVNHHIPHKVNPVQSNPFGL